MDTVLLALRVVLSLAAVLGLLWLAQRRLTRKNRVNGAEKLVTVVTRQGIGQKASVVVVETAGKRFLLGVTEQSVNVLHTSDAPMQVASTAPEVSPARAFELALIAAGEPALDPSPSPAKATVAKAPVAKLPAGKMGGSILSPATWKQAAAFVRQGS